MELLPICPSRLEKLLICTDSSPDSQGAFSGALALAQSCGSKIILLQVLEFNPEFEAMAPEIVARREDEIYAQMEKARALAGEMDVPLDIRVRRSETAYQGIVEEAEKIKPDLIIMGKRGLTRFFRLLMGNVTARVIGHSPFHVLVIPKGVTLNFQTILIASDGSPHGYAAWQEAQYMAQRVGAKLIALSVAPRAEDVGNARTIVQRLKAEADQAGLPLETLVLQGRPFEVIVKAAQENQVDLIVMGAFGLTNLKALLMGSVTERVIATSTCPVLVVKQRQ